MAVQPWRKFHEGEQLLQGKDQPSIAGATAPLETVPAHGVGGTPAPGAQTATSAP